MAWYNGQVTQSCSNQYYCDGSVEGGAEGGADISTPYGSPITSVTSGKVVGVGPVVLSGGRLGIGQVVTVRGPVSYFHGQTQDVYYQHLINTTVKKGDNVQVGQVLGHSNRWIEFGLNPPWSGPWASPHPSGARWINPVKSGYLKSLQTSGPGGSIGPFGTGDPCLACGDLGSPAYVKCHMALAAKTGNPPDCAKQAIAANSPISQPAIQQDLTGWLSDNIVNYAEHIAIFLLAILLIILGFVLIGFAPATKLATKAGKAVMLA